MQVLCVLYLTSKLGLRNVSDALCCLTRCPMNTFLMQKNHIFNKILVAIQITVLLLLLFVVIIVITISIVIILIIHLLLLLLIL